jgi:hypothetical protein
MKRGEREDSAESEKLVAVWAQTGALIGESAAPKLYIIKQNWGSFLQSLYVEKVRLS